MVCLKSTDPAGLGWLWDHRFSQGGVIPYCDQWECKSSFKPHKFWSYKRQKRYSCKGGQTLGKDHFSQWTSDECTVMQTPSNLLLLSWTARCQCKVPPRERRNCGYPGISPIECMNAGCCFNDLVPDLPWCFAPKPRKGNISVCLVFDCAEVCEMGSISAFLRLSKHKSLLDNCWW